MLSGDESQSPDSGVFSSRVADWLDKRVGLALGGTEEHVMLE